MRVWQHFVRKNGLVLAAGISYQSLFALFAALYIAFAGVGIWLGASPRAIDGLIDIINSYVPALIGDSGEGSLVGRDQLVEIARGASGTLSITGIIAIGALIMAMTGWVTFIRISVRDVFDLSSDGPSPILMKLVDFLAACGFGLLLVLGSVLGSIGSFFLRWLSDFTGIGAHSAWFTVLTSLLPFVTSLLVNTLALAAIYRFLAGTALRWRRIWPAALIGGLALTVLQLGIGLLIGATPSNPLLAAFAVLIGLLLWLRLIGIVLLGVASWISVASGSDVPEATLGLRQRARSEDASTA